MGKITAFKTESGSVYEVNFTLKKIRRLSGEESPTKRQGKDGDWKDFFSVTVIKKGHPVLITWTDNEPVVTPGAFAASTITSRIIEIIYDLAGKNNEAS